MAYYLIDDISNLNITSFNAYYRFQNLIVSHFNLSFDGLKKKVITETFVSFQIRQKEHIHSISGSSRRIRIWHPILP